MWVVDNCGALGGYPWEESRFNQVDESSNFYSWGVADGGFDA